MPPPVIGSTEIHGPYAIDAPQCGSCHRGHNAQSPNLLVKGSQSSLCFSCHDGTAANANVQAHYALVRPTNNPATREYYSHDATAPSSHVQAGQDEFGGVTNRHSECADCHDSHNARPGPDSAQTLTGWDASGRLAGVSGVSVINGAAGSAPQYSFLSGIIPGSATNLMTREYQLCFKCHSGFTKLTDNTGLKPSQYALDKAVELNPANPSFHPVEAAGKNQSPKMAENLLGTSPYKLWNFTPGSTIRCLNCHASSETPDVTAVPAPEAGGPLAPHTSANRGILLRPYKDRVLKATNDAYSAGDFALCYVCHGEAPFSSETATATNFKLHGLHLTTLAGKGSGGTDIDTPGAGQGNAVCAECHFRLHSTTNKVGTQAVDGSRLVNFAPNVMANGATLSWTSTGIGSGSCTLTCHGASHSGYKYSP
jgi:predicted CXXCH cytochrome family protein